MKDKFINSSKQEKATVHITMCVLSVSLLVLLLIYHMIIIGVFLLASIVLESLFIYWSKDRYKLNELNKPLPKVNSNVNDVNALISDKDLVLNDKNVGKYINYRRIESFEILDDLILVGEEEYILNNKYSENLCFCENIDIVNLLDIVSFKHEESNEFDKDTIGAYVGENKIGLLFKGSCRNMLIDSVKYNKYYVKSFVYYKSVKLNRIGIKIGYYSKVVENETYVSSLLKTDKKDMLTNKKRYEEFSELSVSDKVILEKYIDNDRILVLSQRGYELGELPVGLSNTIINNVELLKKVYAKVESIDIDSKDFCIKIYIQNNKKVI